MALKTMTDEAEKKQLLKKIGGSTVYLVGYPLFALAYLYRNRDKLDSR